MMLPQSVDINHVDRGPDASRDDVTGRVAKVLPAIEQILKCSGIPGLSFAVLHQGEVAHMSHLGFRDVSSKLKSDNETRHSINSMTKGFIAALVGIHVAKGTLEWETKIKSVFPDFRSLDPVVEEHATVVDMLSHRTGISNFDAFWLHSRNTILLGRDQTLPAFSTLKPRLSFRTAFLYSNFGYEIVARILEKRTGKSLTQLLQEEIFEPLAMSRTSTEWVRDDNSAKSYCLLQDLTPVEVPPPQLGKGKLMEASGGIKSTISDLIPFYNSFLESLKDQFQNERDETPGSIFKHCRKIVANHARLEGDSLREQGYGMGWVRAELPGQLGRISQNVFVEDNPVAGKGAPSELVLYHHGAMPGSISCVAILPDRDVAIIVLQNSLAPLNTADFVTQALIEAVLDVPERNDYVALTREFVRKGLDHVNRVQEELNRNRKPNTRPRAMAKYPGDYWNSFHKFHIRIEQVDGRLQMRFQDDEHELYDLEHYEDDTFSWIMSYDEMAKRGRNINDYVASFYLIKFQSSAGSDIDSLHWAWDITDAEDYEIFRRE